MYRHLQINARESLRFELIERFGRTVVRISRWKADARGVLSQAGPQIEFAERHATGVSAMLLELHESTPANNSVGGI
jgi:hypothetical protein